MAYENWDVDIPKKSRRVTLAMINQACDEKLWNTDTLQKVRRVTLEMLSQTCDEIRSEDVFRLPPAGIHIKLPNGKARQYIIHNIGEVKNG